jgi:hypothetical protein
VRKGRNAHVPRAHSAESRGVGDPFLRRGRGIRREEPRGGASAAQAPGVGAGSLPVLRGGVRSDAVSARASRHPARGGRHERPRKSHHGV